MPGIHVLFYNQLANNNSWMPVTSAGMTNEGAESPGENKPDNCGLRPHPHRAVGPVYPFPFSPLSRPSTPTPREALMRGLHRRGRGCSPRSSSRPCAGIHAKNLAGFHPDPQGARPLTPFVRFLPRRGNQPSRGCNGSLALRAKTGDGDGPEWGCRMKLMALYVCILLE